MKPLNVSTTIGWSSGGKWTEAYAGVHYLIYSILPEHSYETEFEHGALCQLGLIGSQHLLEVTLGELLEPYVKAQSAESRFSMKKFQHEGFARLRDKWISELTPYGKIYPEDKPIEPYASAEILLSRRNGSAHKSSDIVTVEMVRSALFTSVECSKSLYDHFQQTFPYQDTLREYPLQKTPLLNEIVKKLNIFPEK